MYFNAKLLMGVFANKFYEWMLRIHKALRTTLANWKTGSLIAMEFLKPAWAHILESPVEPIDQPHDNLRIKYGKNGEAYLPSFARLKTER